ncbi:Lipopolysaccharide biosynthesis protein, LPS:glycosyltransferase [Marinococcus luteus]|uniref:Lipopolysaccharide biosynthesis protein, LPS:glycosyltransferase n=1 Tax=Marinococcus luteus TaxID=1122204 RepID=A0A1H2QHE4_9BACI|nr:glycosyltransferase family 8 protein [Marinococcus luteus]SDW06637.1 Lipopolysaccharide biosynthesis protein, LPS:glycosyltransferase [Marinococcus luteus]
MNSTQKYVIASIADNHYGECLSVMITSLLHHTARAADISFCIIDTGLSEKNKSYLQQIADYFHSEIHLIAVEDLSLPHIYWSAPEHARHLSAVDYCRLLLPYVVDPSAERLLYIDADTVVREDVTSLWEEHPDDFLVAATDYIDEPPRTPIESIPKKYKYFNTGVLMINAPKWREERLSDTLFSYIKRHKQNKIPTLEYALNALLFNKQHPLHPKWNTTTDMFTEPLPADASGQQIIEAIRSPAIAHFNGPVKPWHSYCPHPYKYEYEYYRHWWMSMLTLSLPQ